MFVLELAAFDDILDEVYNGINNDECDESDYMPGDSSNDSSDEECKKQPAKKLTPKKSNLFPTFHALCFINT
jgi:hypothetical protein